MLKENSQFKKIEQQENKEKVRMWLTLLKLVRPVENILRKRFIAEFNITLPQFDVMAALNQYGDSKMSEISSKLRVSNGNTTGVIDRLVTDGLVKRNSVLGDRRAFKICLTDKGVKKFDELAFAHNKWINDFFVELSIDETIEIDNKLKDLINTMMI